MDEILCDNLNLQDILRHLHPNLCVSWLQKFLKQQKSFLNLDMLVTTCNSLEDLVKVPKVICLFLQSLPAGPEGRSCLPSTMTS